MIVEVLVLSRFVQHLKCIESGLHKGWNKAPPIALGGKRRHGLGLIVFQVQNQLMFVGEVD